MLFIIYVILSSLGLILFKVGGKDLEIGIHNQLFNMQISLPMVLGIVCYLASFLLWLVIVNKSELSYIYPLSIACINILILFGSRYILNEAISLQSLIGVVVIIIGVVIMKLQ